MTMNRKEFIQRSILGATLLGSSTLGYSKSSVTEIESFLSKEKQASQKHAIGLTCEPIPTVRIAFIGLGMRGYDAVRRYMHIDGVEVVALCECRKEKMDAAQEILKKNGRSKAVEYLGEDAWMKLCQRDDIDLVYLCTPWILHTPQAVYAMKHGKHVATEVPAALTLKECWELVDTCEQTRRHCMMLENCCYDFFELTTLNMAQQDILGEIIHAECAYIHDLRSLCFDKESGYADMWRLKYNEKHTGNPYPTHGLGPVAQVLNINRGDRLEYLTSMSTNQYGMSLYAAEKFGSNSPEARTKYKLGDMNSTMIKTKEGKTILVQHDITSPRPYDRIHKLSGTKGYVQKYPTEQIALEPNAHEFCKEEEFKSLMERYEHPLSKKMKEVAQKVGGHGGMDYIMDYRLIYCLRNGLPLDQNVYDAATWSSLVELTELSIQKGSMPVAVPDFTRGNWNLLKGFHMADI
ncbi:MAG: Gfo/Idh/MocA family oxidoreductase [Bacteroidales bacterium]|nr:Gfo/Idh/MocA family oxidoreductase [Bacteroidales bacterium]